MPVAERQRSRLGLAILVIAVAVLARPALAASPFLTMPPEDVRLASPTYRYANMSNEEAYAELDRRGVPYTKAGVVDGVRAPIRLTGLLHGVDVHSALPPDKRADSIFEILDARLALALDDFCELLARHDIVEVVHYTMYRPNGPAPESTSSSRDASKRASGKRSGQKAQRAGTPRRKSLGKGDQGAKRRSGAKQSKRKQKAAPSKGKPSEGKPAAQSSGSRKPTTKASSKPKPAARSAAKSRSGSKHKNKGRKGQRAATEDVKKPTYAPPGTRHPAGLAIDVGGFRKRDGRMLSVAHHFEGRLGAKTCGPNAQLPKSAEGRELWSIVCEAADLGLFTYVLTPNYNKWHADHFHMEIRGDVPWFLYH